MASAANYNILVTALGKTDASFRHMKAELLETSGLRQLSSAAAVAGRAFAGLGSAMSGVLGPLAGIGAGFGLVSMAKSAQDWGAQLYIASQKTGVASDALAKLHYVGSTVNVDAEQMDKALYRLNLTVQKSAVGLDKHGAAMFRGLGIPLKDAKGHLRDMTAILADLSEATKRNPQFAQLIAGTAFSAKAGAVMIPVLEKGRHELKALYDTFSNTYGRITPQIVRSAYEAHEAWGRLDLAASGLKFTLGSLLAPAMTDVVVALTKLIVASREFLSTGLPDFLSKRLSVSRSDVDALAKSFDGLGSALTDVWRQAKPLGDELNSLGAAVDLFDKVQYWPDWLKNAAPAARDFVKALRGDVGAAMRTDARMFDITKGVGRAGGELIGGVLGSHPLNAKRFHDVWTGKKISAMDIRGADTTSVWDSSKWLNFSGTKSPLGMRLNNPGDLRAWGATPTVNTASGRFAQFPNALAGISAAAGNLLAYKRHGWTTIGQIISHWAPASENNTKAYIGAVSRSMGVSSNTALDLSNRGTLQRLLTAIFTREMGSNPYSKSLISSGIDARLSQAGGRDGKVAVKIDVSAPHGTSVRAHHSGETVSGLEVGRRFSYA